MEWSLTEANLLLDEGSFVVIVQELGAHCLVREFHYIVHVKEVTGEGGVQKTDQVDVLNCGI